MKYDMICVPMKSIKKRTSLIKEELNSRIEIQQRSLQTYSREIFDNIAQVLSLVKFQLSIVQNDEAKNGIAVPDSGKLLGKAIADLRNLTKQLSPDEIIKQGFASAIQYELKRLHEAGFCQVTFLLKGKPVKLEAVAELIVFCILQQLSYPALSIYQPGSIIVNIHYRQRRIEIGFTRDCKGEPLFLDDKELEKINQRLKTINSKLEYKPDQESLQITINI